MRTYEQRMWDNKMVQTRRENFKKQRPLLTEEKIQKIRENERCDKCGEKLKIRSQPVTNGGGDGFRMTFEKIGSCSYCEREAEKERQDREKEEMKELLDYAKQFVGKEIEYQKIEGWTDPKRVWKKAGKVTNVFVMGSEVMINTEGGERRQYGISKRDKDKIRIAS